MAIIGGAVVILGIILFVLVQTNEITLPGDGSTASAASPSPIYNASDGPCVTTVLSLLDTDMHRVTAQGVPNGVNNGQVAQQYGSDSKVWSAFTRGTCRRSRTSRRTRSTTSPTRRTSFAGSSRPYARRAGEGES